MGFEPMSPRLQAHWFQVFNMPVLFQRYMYLFIWEELCVCYIVFLINALFFFFFFFFGGDETLSMWNNLWDKVILQLCFVHLLLVPYGNWLALNMICGLVVMGVAYVLFFDLSNFIFVCLFVFFFFLGILYLFTLNYVFLRGHSKSAAPGWRLQTIYGTPQVTCIVICISNPWSKLS